MRRFNRIITAIIIVILLTGVQLFLLKKGAEYEPKTLAVFAAKDIPQGTVLTPDMLTEKEINISMAHKQSFTRIGDAVGRTAKMALVKDEMLLGSRTGEPDTMQEILVVNKENRLYTVEFKADQANGWWLKVDGKVDILFVPNKADRVIANDEQVVHTEPSVADKADQSIKELAGYTKGVVRLEGIRIAALIDEEGHLLENGKRTKLPKYVCFEVTCAQDEFLAWAKGNGRIEVSVVP